MPPRAPLLGSLVVGLIGLFAFGRAPSRSPPDLIVYGRALEPPHARGAEGRPVQRPRGCARRGEAGGLAQLSGRAAGLAAIVVLGVRFARLPELLAAPAETR